MSQITQKESNS